MINKKRLILALSAIVLIIVLSVVLTVISNMRFKLVDSSPKGSAFPTSSNELAFIFNKELDKSKPTKDDVSINPASDFAITADYKTLKITLASAPTTDFTITIRNITSKSGATVATVKRSFKVKYVAYKDLSDYEKQRQVNQSDNSASVDPIINQLPIRASDYTIALEAPASVSATSGQSQPLALKVIISKTNATYDDVNNIMLKVYADLKARGFNPDNYYINSDYDAP